MPLFLASALKVSFQASKLAPVLPHLAAYAAQAPNKRTADPAITYRQADLEQVQLPAAAFDLAYSSAETYRTSHIEKVFGPMDKMDEPLFFLILSRMSSNLASCPSLRATF